MHFLGLAGMPRRIPDYPDMYGSFNTISTVGSLTSAVGILLFVFIVIQSIYFRDNYYENNSWSCQLSPQYDDFRVDLLNRNKPVENIILIVPKYNFFSRFSPSFSHNTLTYRRTMGGYLYNMSSLNKFSDTDHLNEINNDLSSKKYAQRVRKTRPVSLGDRYK